MARSTKESSSRQPSHAGGTSATQLLKKDHATVKQLFARYDKQGDRAKETKENLFSEIQRELETHSTIEEEIFYPATREEVGGTEDLVEESVEEHNVVKSLLRELAAMSPEEEEFDAKMQVLHENVEHHIQEEEGEMFPKVEQQLSHERLNQLGAEMQARKEALAQPTIKRIMSGVSGLIFGNGETTDAEEERGEQSSRAQTRGRGRSERTAERTEARSGGGQGGRTSGARAGGRGSRRRSTAKSSTKQRGSKTGTGGARAAQKPSTASAKKRRSGRSAETRGAARRSRSHKRTAAGGGNRRRGSAKASKRR